MTRRSRDRRTEARLFPPTRKLHERLLVSQSPDLDDGSTMQERLSSTPEEKGKYYSETSLASRSPIRLRSGR